MWRGSSFSPHARTRTADRRGARSSRASAPPAARPRRTSGRPSRAAPAARGTCRGPSPSNGIRRGRAAPDRRALRRRRAPRAGAGEPPECSARSRAARRSRRTGARRGTPRGSRAASTTRPARRARGRWSNSSRRSCDAWPPRPPPLEGDIDAGVRSSLHDASHSRASRDLGRPARILGRAARHVRARSDSGGARRARPAAADRAADELHDRRSGRRPRRVRRLSRRRALQPDRRRARRLRADAVRLGDGLRGPHDAAARASRTPRPTCRCASSARSPKTPGPCAARRQWSTSAARPRSPRRSSTTAKALLGTGTTACAILRP